MPALALAQPLGISTPKTSTELPFSLYINDIDRILFVDTSSYQLTDPGGTQPPNLTVKLTDPDNVVGKTINRRDPVRWVDNVQGKTLFSGWVKLIEPDPVANYAEWTLTASHVESILDFLYVPSINRPAENADTRIRALMAACEPTAAPLAMFTGGGLAVTAGLDAGALTGQTLRAAIEATLAAATTSPTGYYVDPESWALSTYQGGSTGVAAPYDISDSPDFSTTVPAAILPQEDATGEVDAVYIKGGTTAGSGTVWATGVTKYPALCVAIDHPESVNADMLAAIGAAELAARNGLTRLQAIVTGFDGWVKGQTVHVTNVPLGYSAEAYVVTGVSMRVLSGTGEREYTLQLGNGPLRLTSIGAVNAASAAQKVTGAQLAAGTVTPYSIAGSCAFDSSDSGYVYFQVPDLGNGYVVVAADYNIHFRQFWAPATGTSSTTSSAGSSHSHTVPGSSHGHSVLPHQHIIAHSDSLTYGGDVGTLYAYDSSNTSIAMSGAASQQTTFYSNANTGTATSTSTTPGTVTSASESSHTHTVPAGALAYGMYLETMPASWSVNVTLEFYSSGSWTTVNTWSGITTANDLGVDLSSYVTQPGEYRLNIKSAAGQPNGGRLVADVSGYVTVKLL